MMRIQTILQRAGRTIDTFIPQDMHTQKMMYRRARLLIWIHIFGLIVLLIMLPSGVLHDVSVPVPFAIIALVMSMWTFKTWGNISISSNILTAIPALVLLPGIFSTGGMYSDNLLWLYLCPFVAFLFTDKFSRIFWMTFVIGFHFFLLFLELQTKWIQIIPSFKLATSEDPYYYFISYLFLFLLMLGIVCIFKLEQDFIIKELREHKDALTRQKEAIEQQANQLKQQEQELKEVNKDLEQFAYVASHDLKEPLRTIGSFTQLIERELNKNGNKSTSEYIHFVRDGVERMNSLITNLLGDIKNKKQEDTVVNLNDIMLIVMNNLSASVKERNATINCSQLPIVKGSPTAYIQLFQNLLGNSLKFQKENIPPDIQIIYAGINGHHHIKVSDNGIGIPKECLPNIFDLYDRGEIEQSHSGQGIGLATCKKIVDRFGGDISVASETNQGTVFTIKLPIVRGD